MLIIKKTSSALSCFLLIAMCACVKVPEHCGDGYDLDPATEFCFENRTYKKCGSKIFAPLSEFCYGKAVYAKCDGDEFDPAKHVCENGALKSVFTVFFNTSGGNPPEIQPVTVDSGAFLGSKFPTAPTRHGYSFNGWFDGTQEYIASSVIVKTMTLAANWTAISVYKVTYDGNGGSGGSVPIDTLSPYFKDSTATVLSEGALTRTGYTFSGWSTTADGTGPSYIAGNTFTVTANTTLYAKWTDATISTFPVTVSSAGIGATGNGNYEAGKIVKISAGNAEGQKFKNWTTASLGVTLANHNSEVTEFTMPANAVTVTANFEALPKFTVTYRDNGSTGGAVPTDGNSPYYSGSTVTVLDKGTLVKTDHSFSGWSTGSNGSGSNYVAGNTFAISENTTLYAKWTDMSTPAYAVRVLSAGANASGNGSYEAGATVAIYAGTPPSGQRFKSWTSNDNITFANVSNATTTFPMPAKHVDVTANFELITYPVTVSSAGTGHSGAGNYAVGATVNIKAGTAPTDLQFNNWTSNDDIVFANANNATTTFIMPSSPVAATANFGPVTYKATVSSAGAGAAGSGDYAYGTTVFIDAGTPPAGQRFKNWNSSNSSVVFADANGAVTTFAMPAAAVTVTAAFEAMPTYAVTVTSTGTGATGSGNYVQGATVSINAGTTASAEFKKWTSSNSNVSFADSSSAATTFIMPAGAVTVTALFALVEGAKSTHIDTRDSKTYKTVVIGGKKWMAQNLNYATTSGSWCYGGNSSNCNSHGRLYDWATAMNINSSYNSGKWGGSDVKHQGVCPAGWHLPSMAEWGDLAKTAGGVGDYGADGTAGTKLKSQNGWNASSVDVGTDDYGFSALPGGNRIPNVDVEYRFYGLGNSGHWWTATERFDSVAKYRSMSYLWDYVGISDDLNNKEYGFSVRCVED